jgi:CubicO group peptidase (beta-lactamase class C family)
MPLVGVLTAAVLVPWDIVVPWLAPMPDSVQEQVDDALDLGLDGIIVYVDRAGTTPAFYSSGWKDKLAREPSDPHALFKIGSIHKLYLAAATARLVADGTVSLDDTLADRLPELAGRIEHADRITLRMLVRHRSGIPNFTDDEDFDWFAPQTDASEHLELVLDEPADFRPDARYRYSNTNYLLIGRILDRVLGSSHEEYIERELLAPLGLSNTYFGLDEVEYDDVVRGYWYRYDDDLRYLGGSMIATAQDVGVFVRALNDGSLLNDDEQAIYSSIYEYGHTGWVPGYYSIARYHQEIDTVVVQFVNTTGGDTWGLSNVTGGKTLGIANAVYGRIVRMLRRT